MENTMQQLDFVKKYNIMCREYAENPTDELLKEIQDYFFQGNRDIILKKVSKEDYQKMSQEDKDKMIKC